MNDDDNKKLIWPSLLFALGYPATMALLWILLATHTPAETVNDDPRTMKIVGCVLVAAISSVFSIFVAIYPIVKRDLRPLLWLIPLVIGWCLFPNLCVSLNVFRVP